MVLKEIPTDNITRPLGRNEVIGLLFRLTIFGAVTYFTIKWMVDAIDPTRKQKVEAQKQAEKLMRQIGVQNVKLSEYEMSIAAHLVDPLTMQITWHDIAGLDEVITELKDTVILPIQKRHLFEGSRLLQPPKGVLLYGPPGCGKTLIAKATAKEAGFRFINLQPSTLTDKWYGESQKLAAAVFSLAIKLQPSIIFIDEIGKCIFKLCVPHTPLNIDIPVVINFTLFAGVYFYACTHLLGVIFGIRVGKGDLKMERLFFWRNLSMDCQQYNEQYARLFQLLGFLVYNSPLLSSV
uniref:Outer mitochondrial transmembrane helix translocase n=1 Tax=Sinocyclocheilus grahami TaxID=75366 RepID=A0A672P9I5_SINGR